ncbi:MAG: hypothetical protein CMJ75_11660 [Planctomycetaceae bacterium]|nr:hypothetical protein [Planctomycetaceae bacterium]
MQSMIGQPLIARHHRRQQTRKSRPRIGLPKLRTFPLQAEPVTNQLTFNGRKVNSLDGRNNEASHNADP